MTLCPIALAVGCVKCPMVKFCPLKETLGDYKKEEITQEQGKKADEKKEQ
jgi:hypothetical protein